MEAGWAERCQRKPGTRERCCDPKGHYHVRFRQAQAESIAKSIARSQVVAKEIAVRPPGEESTAREIESDVDKGIENNLDAVLVGHKLDSDVKCA